MTCLHWILVPSAWVRHFISLWQQFPVGISFIRHLVHPPQLGWHFSEVSCANIVQASLPGTQSQNLHAEMKHMFEVNVTNYVTGQHDWRQNETRVWDHCHCDVTGLHDWRQVVRQLLETQCTQSTISSKSMFGDFQGDYVNGRIKVQYWMILADFEIWYFLFFTKIWVWPTALTPDWILRCICSK